MRINTRKCRNTSSLCLENMKFSQISREKINYNNEKLIWSSIDCADNIQYIIYVD